MKQQHYKKLSKILAAGFFVCGIVPICIIATTSIITSKQATLIELELIAEQVVQHRQDVINNFLDHQVERMSTIISLYSLDYLKEQANLDRIFFALGRSGSMVDLQLVNTDGTQIAYVGPYKDKISGKNFKGQNWFTETLVRGNYVSDLFSGYRSTPHFVIALTDPLKEYVLRATINSGIFNSLLNSAQIGSHGDVFIVNKDGLLQTPSLQRHGDVLTPNEKNLVRYHNGVSIAPIGDYLYATTWLNSGNWLLMLTIKTDDMLTSYYRHLYQVLVVVAITIILFFIISIVLSRFIVARVTKVDSEAAELDQQMAHIEKMANIGRLAAGVAHEINNPLQMILAQAGWLEELLPEEDPAKIKNLDEYTSTIAKIKHHVERASKITHRLLGFARKINEEQQNVLVNDLIEETLSFLEKEAQYNNINVRLNLDPNLPPTTTEGHRLQQVLLNLVENALDAVSQNGQVDISTSHNGKEISIEIQDDGPGIPPEVMQKIWDPFFTTKEQGKGTGLGLSISQNIIHSLGGKLEARNRMDASGALFTVRIPLHYATTVSTIKTPT